MYTKKKKSIIRSGCQTELFKLFFFYVNFILESPLALVGVSYNWLVFNVPVVTKIAESTHITSAGFSTLYKEFV